MVEFAREILFVAVQQLAMFNARVSLPVTG
jgi:hypothetical protein